MMTNFIKNTYSGLTACFRVAAILMAILVAVDADACTSAIVAASATRDGRPLLWKHRDTSTVDNKVEFVAGDDGEFDFVALFNAADRSLSESWMGMNSVGFAVMNTASYNLKDDKVPQSKMDKEGIVMTMALKHCRSVDDFAALLDSLPRPMGVEANFGVIDASGAGAFFETNNHSYIRYDLSDAPGGVLVRTNYSHGGRSGEGYGFIREANACHLLAPGIANHDISPELLTETVSRNFWHDLYKRDFSEGKERWVIDQDFIPRFKSTATVVIEGADRSYDPKEVVPGQLADQYIMWTGLGYPPVSEIVPVWCTPDGVDERLRGIGENGHAPLSDLAKARRSEVFPHHKGNGDKYIDMPTLFNSAGTGYVQVLVPQNLEVYAKFRDRGARHQRSAQSASKSER